MPPPFLVLPTSRVYRGNVPLSALYKGSTKVWEPIPPWNPSMLSGLRIWLDASQLGLANGANVPSWTSLTDASQVGAPIPGNESGPFAKYVANGLNGKPVVRFAPSAGLRWTSTGINTSWTVAYLGRLIGPTLGRVLDAIYPPSNLLIGFWNGYQDVCYHEGFTAPDARQSATNNWKIYAGDGLPSPLTRFFRNDGIGLSTLLGTTTTGGGWQNMFALNGYSPNGVEETCDCEVAEVCLYNRRLTGTERIQVENYLRTKWGL